MGRLRLALLGGAACGVLTVVACSIDESGTAPGDSGGIDVIVNGDSGGPDTSVMDVIIDVPWDVPDLGMGETESGLPCTCVNMLPSGYTAIEYLPDATPGCTTGFGNPVNYITDPTAPPSTCTCTCGAAPMMPPKCSCGSDPVTFSLAFGNGACTGTGLTVQADLMPGCDTDAQPLTETGNGLNSLQGVTAGSTCTPSGGACGAPMKTQTVPGASSVQGRECPASAPPSQGSCTTGDVCFPNTGGAYKQCITNFAVVTCPSDFPVAHRVGTSIADTRACSGSCTTCTLVDAGSCGTPVLGLWTSSTSCAGKPDLSLPVDNATCLPTPNGGWGNSQTVTSAQYGVPQDGGACAFTGSFAATGGLDVNGAFTICCRP